MNLAPKIIWQESSEVNIIDLKNRTAIVTGGARGIGFAIAKRMVESGAAVVVWDIDADALDKAVAALKTTAAFIPQSSM
jgi:2-dehydro-3-deoxy-L-rhamnonate dehydrogenase (NAD+)